MGNGGGGRTFNLPRSLSGFHDPVGHGNPCYEGAFLAAGGPAVPGARTQVPKGPRHSTGALCRYSPLVDESLLCCKPVSRLRQRQMD